jgi:uncharacterized membrane protein YfcA
MPTADPLTLAFVAAVFGLAGGVKGVTGMGLPTVAMSLLGLAMSPVQAAALLVLPSLLTNLSQCRGPHLRTLLRRLWPGWLAVAVVTVTAPGLGGAVSAETARRALGSLLVAYGLWGLWRPALPDLSGRGPWLGVLAGAATGAVTAVTAVAAMPWVPYLQTLRLDRNALVQALGLSFTVATVALAVRLHTVLPLDGITAGSAVAVALALGGALGGMALGERVRGRLGGPAFQRTLFAVFVALGLANLARG